MAATPVHPTGKEFYGIGEIIPGAYLETNLSRAGIIQRAQKYLTRYGVPFGVVVGDDA